MDGQRAHTARLRATAAVRATRAALRGTDVAISPERFPVLSHLLTRPVPWYDESSGPVSDALHARIDPGALDELETRLEGGLRTVWDEVDPPVRRRLALNFGTFLGVEGITAATGLRAVEPPESIHAMARGPLAAGGDPLTADIVVSSFTTAGVDIPRDGAVLDFGGSSGRVVRVLQAWRPDVRWMGCDPNDEAISWATEHLAPVRFFVSPGRPPLPLDDGELDAAFAISIWSHFAAEPARIWLDEMHRVIRPGGALLVTTHGWDTLAQLVRRDLMTRESAEQAAATMLTAGHNYYDIFGPEGDWGVRDPGWGNGFLTAEWMAATTRGRWTIDLFLPGRLDANQDVYVLRRR